MASSAVPAALDYLIAQLPAVLPAGVELIDGEFVGEYIQNELVHIKTVDSIQQAPAQLGAMTREETFDIQCTARAYAGDVDPSTRRDRVMTIVATVESWIRQVPGATLGGAVRYAQVFVSGALTWGGTASGGTAAELDFTIRCEGRI